MPNPSPSKAGDAGVLMGLLSTSFVAWLLIGALTYGGGNNNNSNNDDAAAASFLPVELVWLLTAMLIAVILVCLILAAAEFPTTTTSSSSRRSQRAGAGAAAYYTAAIMGFGASTVGLLFLSNGWSRSSHHQRIFWALGGLFGGIFFEASTGFFSACARRLQASSVFEAEPSSSSLEPGGILVREKISVKQQ